MTAIYTKERFWLASEFSTLPNFLTFYSLTEYDCTLLLPRGALVISHTEGVRSEVGRSVRRAHTPVTSVVGGVAVAALLLGVHIHSSSRAGLGVVVALDSTTI